MSDIIERRIEYYEPNDIDVDMTSLTIYVELEIKKKSRNLLQEATSLKFNTVMRSKDNVNFFSEELTTGIESILLMESEGSKELLGINSIDIKYNSWYYPQVTIEFIDVRAGGVINSMESNTENSVYASLFALPISEFLLTVKGYLGKSVTYSLATQNVTVSVDEATGCYKIKADLMGYIFGVLQDIPMHLLVLSPILTNTELGYFKGTTIRIPTMLDLYRTLDIKRSNTHEIENDKIMKYNIELEKYIEMLNEVSSLSDNLIKINEYKNEIVKLHSEKINSGKSLEYNFIYTLNEQGIEVGTDESVNMGIIYRYKDDTIYDIRLKKTIKEFFNFLLDVNHKIYFLNKEELNNERLEYYYNSCYLEGDVDDWVVAMNNNTWWAKHDIEVEVSNLYYEHLDKYLLELLNDKKYKATSRKNFILRDATKRNEPVFQRIIYFLKQKITELRIKIGSERREIFKKSLGYDLTIGRLCEIIVSHLNNFYMLMENIEGDIKSDIANNKRTLSTIYSYKIDNKIINTDTTIHGFPLITSTDNTVLWFSETSNLILSRFREVKLVEDTAKAILNLQKATIESGVLGDYNEKWGTYPSYGFPTIVSDLIDGYKEKNVYAQCGTMSDIILEFSKRCFVRYLTTRGDDTTDFFMKDEIFYDLEARNIIRAKFSDISFITAMSNYMVLDFVEECKKKLKDFLGENYTWESAHPSISFKDYSGLTKYDEQQFRSNNNAVVPGKRIIKNSFYASEIPNYSALKNAVRPLEDLVFFDNNDFLQAKMGSCAQVKMHLDGYAKVFPKRDEIPWELGWYDTTPVKSEYNYGLYHHKGMKKQGGEQILLFNDRGCGGVLKYFDALQNFNFPKKGTYDTFKMHGFGVKKHSGGQFYPIMVPVEAKDAYNIEVEGFSDADYVIAFFNGMLGNYNSGLYAPDLDNIDDSKDKFKKIKWESYGFKKVHKIALILLGAHMSEYPDSLLSNFHLYAKYMYKQAIKPESEGGENLLEDIKRFATYFAWEYGTYDVSLYDKDLNVLKKWFNNDNYVTICNLSAGYYPPVTTSKTSNPTNLDEEEMSFDKWVSDAISRACGEVWTTVRQECSYIVSNINNMSKEVEDNAKKMLDVNLYKEIYETYKNIYDRWLCLGGTKPLTISDIRIVNHFFDDLSNEFIIDTDQFDIFERITFDKKNYGFLQYLSDMFTENGFIVAMLPYSGNVSNSKEMWKSYSTIDKQIGFSITALYGKYESKRIASDEYGKEDGLDVKNEHVVIKNNDNVSFFGVTYGSPQQRIFQKIQCSTDTPNVTAVSIASNMRIAAQGDPDSSGEKMLQTDNLYSVFANNSYECKFRSVGNMQIFPLQCFQLNNFPLFNKSYLITEVVHHISGHNVLTTDVRGTRITRNRTFFLSGQTYGNELVYDAYTSNETKGGKNKIVKASKKDESECRTIYSKEKTLIMIDAGHCLSKKLNHSKQSPEVDINTDIEYDEDENILDSYQVDEENNPYREMKDIIENESEEDKKKKEEVYRMREYWGNRKMAEALSTKLRSDGYKVEVVTNTDILSSSQSSIDKKININYENDNNCILISLHTNAIEKRGEEGQWNSTNRWMIFAQNKEYVIERKEYITAPHITDSYCLAKSIHDAMSNETNKNKHGMKIDEIKVYEESKNTIHPLTRSAPPTVLIESLFHTNKDAIVNYYKKEYREMLVEIYAEGIKNFLNTYSDENEKIG